MCMILSEGNNIKKNTTNISKDDNTMIKIGQNLTKLLKIFPNTDSVKT